MPKLHEKISNNIIKQKELEKKDEYHKEGYIIKKINNIFIAQRKKFDPIKYSLDFFIANNEEELSIFLNANKSYKELHNNTKRKKVKILKKQLKDGVILTGKKAGEFFEIYIKDSKMEKPIMCYNGAINSFLTYYIFNELTIQGAEYLPERLRGKGYANEMKDLAEELMGLKAVPHELNYTEGCLSDSARKSWEKRALQKNVPGMNNDINIENKVNKIDELFEFLNSNILLIFLSINNINNYRIKAILDENTKNNQITENSILWLEDVFFNQIYTAFPFTKNKIEQMSKKKYNKEDVIKLDIDKIKINNINLNDCLENKEEKILEILNKYTQKNHMELTS